VDGVLPTAVLDKGGRGMVVEGHETLTPESFNYSGRSCKLTQVQLKWGTAEGGGENTGLI
jgi:hypothetical protein